jgi:electron transport complex protein RnfB
MIVGTLALTTLALLLGVALLLADRCLADDRGEHARLVAAIESVLPRIQCAQCGFPGCRAYAEALADRRTSINRCPPGGEGTLRRLVHLLGEPNPPPLDRNLGQASMDHVAIIDESACVGCNLCARICPVDAIVGIPQMLHTVISAACTGCELCIASCPVDCIDMVRRNA